MNRVACVAGDISHGVGTASNIGARNVFVVAGEAGIDHLPGIHQRKRPDGCLSAASLDVILPWSVTSLAARLRLWQVARGNAFEVGILVEIHPNVGVAPAADSAANVGVLSRHADGCKQYDSGKQMFHNNAHLFMINRILPTD